LRGTKEAFVENRERLVEDLDKMKKKKDWRHHELMEIQKKETRNKMEDFSSFIGAFQWMAKQWPCLGNSSLTPKIP
jgi:hypothetical protein